MERAQRRLRARARERVGRRRRGRDSREDRAPRGREAGAARARDRDVEGVLDLRGEDPEALGALAEPLRAAAASGAKLVDVLERAVRHRATDDDRVNILTRRARDLQRQAAARRRGARGLEPRPRHRLREPRGAPRDRGHPAAAGATRTSSSRRSTRWSIAPRAMLDPRTLKDVFRELGKTYGEQLAAAVRRRRRVAEAARGRPRLRGDGRSRGDLPRRGAVDRRHRRQDAARRGARRATSRDRGAAERRRALARAGRGARRRRAPGRERSSRSIRRTTKRSPSSRSSTPRPAAGSRSSSSTWRASRRARRRAQKTELLRKIARVFEEQLDDKNQALDALVNALGEDFHDRETAQVPRAHGAGHRALGRGHPDRERLAPRADRAASRRSASACTSPSGTATTSVTPSTRSRTTRRSSSSIRTTSARCARWGELSTRRPATGSSWARRSRARSTSPSNDVDRKEILTELGELLDAQMSRPIRRSRTSSARSRSTRSSSPPLENLERIYAARGAEPGARRHPARARCPRSPTRQTSRATKLRIGALYETSLNDPPRAAQVYREVVDARAGEPPRRCAASRASTRRSSSGPTSSKVLETQLDVVTTERERIDVLMQLATIQEEQFLKADIAAQRLEQVLEIDPNHEEAYFALERSYRKLRQWLDLINTYERHIAATLERKTKVELYGAIAQVYADEVEDAERAIDAYQNIVDLDDTNIPALEALAKLYEKQGDAAQSIDYMTRVAELTQDTKQRVESFYRIGKALDEKLGDRVAAQERYEMALDLDPVAPADAGGAPPDRDRRRGLRQGRALPRSGAELHARRRASARACSSSSDKLRDEMLGEHDERRARVGGGVRGRPRERGRRACRSSTSTSRRQIGRRPSRCSTCSSARAASASAASSTSCRTSSATVCAALGKDDKALKAYTAAHQLDLTDPGDDPRPRRGLLPAEGLGRGAHQLPEGADRARRGRDRGARRRLLQARLHQARAGPGQAGDQQLREGARRRRGAPADARSAGVALHGAQGLEAGRRLQAADPRQRRSTATSASGCSTRSRDIWNDQDKNPLEGDRGARGGARAPAAEPRPPAQAARALPGDRELGEDDRHAPGHRRDREGSGPQEQSSSTRWRSSIATRRATRTRAVELFNEALDLNPQYLEAFERINKILTAKKDWKALERAFRKMLRRMSTANVSNPDLEFNLWHNLGLIYRDRLKDMTSAIEAFKMATRFKPDEAVERQILAELYEATDQMEAAIGEHAARPPEGPAARRSVPEPLQALPADARVRPRVVHVRRARVPAQGGRRGAALLRGLPPARDDPGEEPPRQRASG